jgi:hypothetical protein
MTKLSNDQLNALVLKRNDERFNHTVEVMNLEELKSYRENCIEAIARHDRMIAKAKVIGGATQTLHAELKEQLEGYVAYIDAKVAETEKKESEVTGLEAIDAFIENWKVRCVEFYMNLKKKYNAVRFENYEINAENLKMILNYNLQRQLTDEQVEEILNRELNRVELDSFQAKIRHAKKREFERSIPKSDAAILERMYGTEDQQRQVIMNIAEKDGERRKAQLIARVEAKAGKIIDAYGLQMGDNMEINGFVKGEIKTVHVQTIYAGGYNIQQLHYRVLVK